MRRDPWCCWDYDGVSQCNAVRLAKTHVLVSGDTEILQRFRVLNKISNRKYDCIEASRIILLFATAIPFIYYFLAIYSSSKFFLQGRRDLKPQPDFTLPMSNLRPVKGLDRQAKRISPRCDGQTCVCPGKTSMEEILRSWITRAIGFLFRG